MFLDRERYVELKEWNKFGISAIYTKKNYGNIKKLEKYVLLNVVLHHDQLISILRIMKVELIG